MTILPFMQRWDQAEQTLAGPSGCGNRCASPNSNWSIINPFNNILDFPAFFTALFPHQSTQKNKPKEPKPDVNSRLCFVGTDGSCRSFQ